MSLINVDTNNEELLKKPKYDPVEPGIYTLEVKNELKVTKSKSSDNQLIKVELILVDDPKKTIFDNLVLTEKSKWKLAQFCKSCGVDSDDDGNIDLSLFQGLTCSASVKQEPYTKTSGQVEMTNKIDEYLWEGKE